MTDPYRSAEHADLSDKFWLDEDIMCDVVTVASTVVRLSWRPLSVETLSSLVAGAWLRIMNAALAASATASLSPVRQRHSGWLEKNLDFWKKVFKFLGFMFFKDF